jgi:UDP-3-O-[3-hydroxymyristoyl] glucosamine N-acyltransferase
MKIPLAELADLIGGSIVGDPETLIQGVAPFDEATEQDITLAGGPKYLKRISQCAAGALIVPLDYHDETHNLIQTGNPALAFAKLVEHFHPVVRRAAGIHPRAVVGCNFSCGRDVSIGSLVAIGDNVSLGDRVQLHPGVYVGDDVAIGNDAVLYPNVSVMPGCKIGHRVVIHAGTVVGSDGYGFTPDGDGYYKLPHTGIVQIDDDVEIGACNTIDRATFGKTWICRGVKTDNLVHIAHNVTVGENTLLVSQVGLSGSVTIGKHAVVAGQAGIAGHLKIGDGAIVGPRAGVAKSVAEGQIVMGAPEMSHKTWLRVQRVIPMLPELKKKLDALEAKLAKTEEKD